MTVICKTTTLLNTILDNCIYISNLEGGQVCFIKYLKLGTNSITTTFCVYSLQNWNVFTGYIVRLLHIIKPVNKIRHAESVVGDDIFFLISECNVGYTTKNGQPCQQCEIGLYGRRCAFICQCRDSERYVVFSSTFEELFRLTRGFICH